MVKSMTGYGRAEETVNGCTITVELRSVNNRYLDCNVRIPRLYLFAEESIKSRVQNTISRGKVDVFVTLDGAGAEEVRVSVNRPLAQQYANALQELAQLCGPTAYRITPETLSRFPEVLMAEKAEENVEEKAQDICRVLDLALAFAGRALTEGEEGVLSLLCETAWDRWAGQLRDGVTVEDCGQVMAVAAAWTALSAVAGALEQSQPVPVSFTAGDLRVDRGSGGMDACARSLGRQAEALMAPFVRDEAFAFWEVEG